MPCRREEKAVTAGTLLGAALELRICFVAPLVQEGREGEAKDPALPHKDVLEDALSLHCPYLLPPEWLLLQPLASQ